MESLEGTHKQHYVPRSYLKRFSSNGELYGYNICKNKGENKGIASWCYLYDFYETDERGFNEIEELLSEVETKTGKDLKKMANGNARMYEDMLPVLQFASLLDMRSPSAISDMMECLKDWPQCGNRFPSNDELITKSKQIINEWIANHRYEKILSDRPINELAVACTQWKTDILLTSDCPLVHCNLADLRINPTGYDIDGFILPIDMKTLFIIFKMKDKERFHQLFCMSPGMIDPNKVNEAIACSAIEYVFFKDNSNHFFNNIKNLIINPRMDKTRELVQYCKMQQKRLKKHDIV